MGDFHTAVSTLLDAFARGLAVIRRKKERLPQDSTQRDADKQLSRSLRKSRADVKNAYGRDLARFGPGFAVGDAEAHSSLAAILFRLNAGFVSIIERFTKGHNTQTDYTALMNLSNASRMEAISTFSQLSTRLSQSSLALMPSPEKHHHHRRKKKPSASNSGKNAHSKSSASVSRSLSETGWVRSKSQPRKTSSKSSATASTPKPETSTPRRPSRRPSLPSIPSQPLPQCTPPLNSRCSHSHLQKSIPHRTSQPQLQPHPTSRHSIVSFASDSTKLGEIPEHKWAPRPAVLGVEEWDVRPVYPVDPYVEPVKGRSMLRRLFGR